VTIAQIFLPWGSAPCSGLSIASRRRYLNDRGVAINMLFFQAFTHGSEYFLSRAWLIDPGEVRVQAAGKGRAGDKEPWNGEFYVSFGADNGRRWDEARRHGFVSGGGGTWYSNSLRMLGEGDRVW
jgi:hypothetical protein